MEEITTKAMLEEKMRECLEGLKYVEQGSEQHSALVNDIEKLTRAYSELEKNENSKVDADRRFREEIRQKDLDRDYKDILERDRMKVEQEVEEKKIKGNKLSSIIDLLVKLVLGLGTTGMYFMFMRYGMNLEFLEHGSITSFSVKELFRSIHPKI